MCSICGSKGEIKHYAFYVYGSEGVELCESCQIVVANFIKNLREVSNRTKLNAIKSYKGELK